jgi:hypothetical protein
MRSPTEIKTLIEARLKKYISRDRTGIRRAMLQLFLKIRTLTISQIFEELNKSFIISYHSVAAMVGISHPESAFFTLPGPAMDPSRCIASRNSMQTLSSGSCRAHNRRSACRQIIIIFNIAFV